MAWKLSVVEYTSNFSRGHNFQTTLTAIELLGSSSLAITAADQAKYFLKRGDIIKIGPSTHTDNVGSYEYKQVTNIKDATIVLDSVTVYDYDSGDPVSGICSGVPENWEVVVGGDQILTTLGMVQRHGTTHRLYTGHRNGFNSFWTRMVAGTSGTASAIRMRLPRPLLQGVEYRLGGYFIASGQAGSGAQRLRLFQNSASAVLLNPSISSSSLWTKVEDSATTSSSVSDWSDAPVVDIYTDLTRSHTLLGADCIYVTHASMVPSASGGAFSFAIDPIRVSQDYADVETFKKAIRNYNFSFGPLDTYTPRSYTLLFEDADATLIKDMEALVRWQNMGHTIMLESDVAGEPPTFGFLSFSTVFHHWDETRIGMNVKFTGI